MSLALHAALLSVHFKFPDAIALEGVERSRSKWCWSTPRRKDRPAKADVLAQANLDRGGNVDENRRAKTPLPVTEPRKPGQGSGRRAAPQRSSSKRSSSELLAQAREAQSRVPATRRSASPRPKSPATKPSGRDLADLSLAAMRLQAQIDRQIEEYQKRPRKKFIGAHAAEYRFAQYEEDWRVKVERVGTLNYPAEARGKLYGNLRLTVTIRPDGTVESIELDRSSGLKVLDAAAFKIVRMADAVRGVPARHPARHRPAGHHAHLVLRPGRQDLD